MRLLNTTTLVLHYFCDDVPLYVILSHVWGKGEVTFDDIGKPYAKDMVGYKKIVKCCEQAVRDGFEWVWIDTCCIDKKSSAELSEAINSMYRWYWQAEICYAYLQDVPELENPTEQNSVFQKSRWFQRGWTLQELLAPDMVEFYGQSWGCIGTKLSLLDTVQAATNIEKWYLVNRDTIKTASIAIKFSWASLRQTTRAEDMAYCLLGLVDINMPMLYGEGQRAFFRLQLEIMKQTNEHTIFAWGLWDDEVELDYLPLGALAPSPYFFKSSACVSSRNQKRPRSLAYEMTNKGLRIELPCIQKSSEGILVVLNCQHQDGSFVGIWLESLENQLYQRLAGYTLVKVDAHALSNAEQQTMYLVAENPPDVQTRDPASHLRVGSFWTECSYRIKEIWKYTLENDKLVQIPLKQDLTGRNIYDGQYDKNKGHVLKKLNIHYGDFACLRIKAYDSDNTFTFSILVGLHDDGVYLKQLHGQWNHSNLLVALLDWHNLSLGRSPSLGYARNLLKFVAEAHPMVRVSHYRTGFQRMEVEFFARKSCVQNRLCWDLAMKMRPIVTVALDGSMEA